jgi:hypothetical protein
MPYDGTNKAKDRGYQLVYALRNLPETHEWSYTVVGGGDECSSRGCALGLACALWPELSPRKFWWVFGDKGESALLYASKIFGITKEQAETIFYGLADFNFTQSGQVTPGDVADALEEALNGA